MIRSRRGPAGRIALAALVAAALAATGALASQAEARTAAPAAEAAKKPDSTCGPKRTASRTVAHTFGKLVMHGTPKRVVALEYSFVDALLAVGVRPVGVADDNRKERILPQYRTKLGTYTSVGLRSTPNLETISSLHPDLIIADADRHANIYKQLSKIAPTIVLDSLRQAYRPALHAAVVIGQAVNRCGAMIARLKRHRANMEKIARAVPDGEKRSVLFAVSSATGFNEHNSLGYTPSVLAELGLQATEKGKNGEPYHELTLETLFSLNPDVMFIARSGAKTMSDGWKDSPIWQQIDAVKNNRVYEVNSDLWSRWRGISAAEVVAQQAVRLLYGKYVPIKVG